VATEWLDSTEARRRFPGIAVDGPVLHQPSTGTVNADRSVAAMQRMAEERGADIAFGERVQSIEDAGDPEHCTGPLVDPDDRSFALEPETWARLLDWVRRHLPGVDPHPVTQTTCLYASSPTDDFVIDRVGRIVVAKAGLGGHGFKFLPEIGRRLADLADGLDLADNPFALRDAGLDEGRSARK
jgi:glycine/D-amino acid oxidase-like deaminating enzyme